MISGLLIAFAGFLPLTAGHASIWHPSMWGFNVTQQTFSYDNRPVAPLTNYTFDQWWFHGHLDYPPHPEDRLQLPAGGVATTEIGCDKSATSFFASSEGGDIRSGDDVCPGSPSSEYHTTGITDLKGCGLAIAYKSNVSEIEPEDFTVFSVNQTCVWTRFTEFQVPARMPPCPVGGCTCAWFWIHSPDSGGEQNYMNGLQCNITGATSNVALATPQVARRCGADPDNGKPNASPGNCTYGAKQPLYWFQAERNNMFEGTYAPPFYTDLYNFKDGAQNDIFQDSYPNGLPVPSPNNTVVPTPFLGGASSSIPITSLSSVSVPTSSAVSTSAPAVTSSASAATTSSSFASSATPDPSASSASQAVPAPSSLNTSLSAPSISTSPPSSFSSLAPPSPSVVTSTSIVVSTLVVTVTAAPSPVSFEPSSAAEPTFFTPSTSSTVTPSSSSLTSSVSEPTFFTPSLSSSVPEPTFFTPSTSSSVPAPTFFTPSTSLTVTPSLSSSVPELTFFTPSTPFSATFSSSSLSLTSPIAIPSSSAFTTSINTTTQGPLAGTAFLGATTLTLNIPTNFTSNDIASSTASTSAGSSSQTNAALDIELLDGDSTTADTNTNANCQRDSAAFKKFGRRSVSDGSAYSRRRSHRRFYDRSQLWHIF